MAKRHLGLGKAAKAKKQKQATPEENLPNELTVELGEEIDANDAVAQVTALWKTYNESEEKTELVLNGIIHECDRILRKAHNQKKGESDDSEKIELSGRFYAIYALALANLAFHTEDSKQVEEFFVEAKDRIEAGQRAFPKLIDLRFANARLLINKIPLTVISKLTADSTEGNVPELLDECLQEWEEAERLTLSENKFECYNAENLDFLRALDDLLDMVDNFGHEEEGDDSDNEEQELVVLGKAHPLYSVQKSDKYNLWWRNHSIVFLENLDKQLESKKHVETEQVDLEVLRRELCKRLGQSYLMEAEGPSNIYTTLTYFSKAKSMGGMSKAEAQKMSQELFGSALKYLRDSQDDQEPETWVNVAEALISLGNTHDLDSEQQEEAYKEAEEILLRANNATNGKFDDILENLRN